MKDVEKALRNLTSLMRYFSRRHCWSPFFCTTGDDSVFSESVNRRNVNARRTTHPSS